jgi:hypothetical protein
MYFLLPVLFALSIGTELAVGVDIGDVEVFKQALEQDGFTVQQGGLAYFDFMKIYNKGVLPAAYGGNPATKYLAYVVPPASGHKVDATILKIMKALGVNANITPFPSLRPDEAIVFVGRTPPECRYFSYDQYLIDRTYGNETRWIWADLTDTINHLAISRLKELPIDRLEILSIRLRWW